MDKVELEERFKKDIMPRLKKELDLDNVMEVPQIKKVAINAGIGGFKDDRAAVEAFTEELGALAGQKPVIRKARKSEAGFKIKQGDIVGMTVTLRGSRMWAFLEKFVNIVLPRVRDFRGLDEKSFDGMGNYSIGLREHTIFPEVNPNAVKSIRSLEISVVTTSKDKEKNMTMLSAVGFPFKKEQN